MTAKEEAQRRFEEWKTNGLGQVFQVDETEIYIEFQKLVDACMRQQIRRPAEQRIHRSNS